MMNSRVWYAINCPICEEVTASTLITNLSLNMGDKIIISDVKSHEPITHFVQNAFGEKITPVSLIINKRMGGQFGFVKNKIDDKTLQLSVLDARHNEIMLKNLKGVL